MPSIASGLARDSRRVQSDASRVRRDVARRVVPERRRGADADLLAAGQVLVRPTGRPAWARTAADEIDEAEEADRSLPSLKAVSGVLLYPITCDSPSRKRRMRANSSGASGSVAMVSGGRPDGSSAVAPRCSQRADVLFGDLRPKRVIAIGESQSAGRLVTYIDAIHPLAHVYDGFLVHSRGGGAAPLSESPRPIIDAPPVVLIRDDVDVPVLTFQTETDVVAIGFFAARQPDGPTIRTWEVAGTAHADTYVMVVGPADQGSSASDTTHLPPVQSIFDGAVACDLPINSGPQHYVLSAALRQLTRWVRSGRSPTSASPLSVRPGLPPILERDALGNAVGGIRTPQVDVPIAAVSGIGQPEGSACSRFGTTIAFDAARIASLYPDHRTYVAAVNRAAKRAVRRGALLAIDARAIRRAAASSGIGR